jgi:hypothetical protein
MKPISTSEQAVMIRTDYSDPAAWETIIAAAQAAEDPFMFNMQVVDDRDYDGASVQDLMTALGKDYPHSFFVIADKRSVTDPDHPLLVVDLLEERGREFRTVPSQVASIDNNLSIANMGFGEFAGVVDETGIFRGIPGM